MNKHIYNKLWFVHYISKIVNLDLIEFKNDNEIAVHFNKFVQFRLYFISSLFSFLFFDTFHYMLRQEKYSKIDLIYMMEIPISYCFYLKATYFFYKKRHVFCSLLDNLNEIDKALQIFLNNSEYFADYAIWLLAPLILTASLIILPMLWLHFYKPFLKIYSLQAIIGIPLVIFLSTLLSMKILFFNRISACNDVLRNYDKQFMLLTRCNFCKRLGKKKIENSYCIKHLLM